MDLLITEFPRPLKPLAPSWIRTYRASQAQCWTLADDFLPEKPEKTVDEIPVGQTILCPDGVYRTDYEAEHHR